MHHSTDTAQVIVTNDLLMASDEGRIFTLVLLEPSAACDTVQHHILLQRIDLSLKMYLKMFLSASVLGSVNGTVNNPLSPFVPWAIFVWLSVPSVFILLDDMVSEFIQLIREQAEWISYQLAFICMFFLLFVCSN